MKDDPITALSLAVANVHTEREKLLQLIRDYRDFIAWMYNDVGTQCQQDRSELQQRANELLGE